MSNPSKPFPLSVVPRQLPRPALAVATALVGVALTGTHTPAQGASASLQTCTTWESNCTTGHLVVIVSLCWFVAFAAIGGIVSLWKPGRRPRLANPMVLACIFLVAFFAVFAGAWVAFASPTLILSAPTSDGPGAASDLISFQ